MYQLNVITHEGRSVANLLAQVVPRIGELISIHHDVTAEASWEPTEGSRRVFNRADWRVTNVIHEFRRASDLRQQVHTITLFVEEPNPAAAT